MSKKKRLKKIVKSHLNRIQDDGEALYNDGITTTAIDRDAQLEAEESLGKLSAANLATALGITNPGNTVTETLNIDKDAVAGKADAFPRDQREVADADGDGIGNNQEIVNLHVELLAIEADAALDAARVVEATTALTATGTHLATLQTEDANGNDDFAAYTAALTAFNTAVTTLETLEGNAAAKVTEATAAHAAMSALPAPAAGIKYTVAATEYTAATVHAGRDAKLAAIVTLKDNIDAQCGIANNRVADANRTAAGATVAPAE